MEWFYYTKYDKKVGKKGKLDKLNAKHCTKQDVHTILSVNAILAMEMRERML